MLNITEKAVSCSVKGLSPFFLQVSVYLCLGLIFEKPISHDLLFYCKEVSKFLLMFNFSEKALFLSDHHHLFSDRLEIQSTR